jgi:hypothetical protein
MEEAIRYRIELVKHALKDYQKQLEQETDIAARIWLRARIIGLEHEMSTLEDLLLSWEEYQKLGSVLPF